MKLKSNRYISCILCAITGLLAVSCIPQKQIVLIRDAKPDQTVFTPSDQVTERYVLQPNDYLFINVSSPTAQLSAFYNPQQATGGNSSTMRQDLFYYGLDDSCRIDFPVAGTIDLKGCNIKQAKEKIYAAISETLSGFTLTVRLATNSFSILGEVSRQGAYTMARNQITIFDAISQAGGFTSYARRREVKILRKSPTGEIETHVIDMTRAESFIESDYYYIYPNDVIYVRPLWFKMFGFGETISIALASSLVTLYLLVRQL